MARFDSLLFVVKLTKRHILSLRQFWWVAVVLMAFGLVAWAGFAQPVQTAIQQDNDKIPVLEIEQLCLQENYKTKVFFTGEVVPRRRASLAFQRSGRITGIDVDQGATVKEKDTIAVLDQRHLDAKEKQLKAELKQAQVVLAELKNGPRVETIRAAQAQVNDIQQQFLREEKKLERATALYQRDAISKQEYEQSLYGSRALKAKLDLASSQLEELEAGTRQEKIDAQSAVVESIEASLQSLQFDREDSVIKAPFDGLVIERFLDEGEIVGPESRVIELIENGHLEIHVGVPVDIARSMEKGNEVDLVSGNWSGKARVKTRVDQVNSATRTQNIILTVVQDDEANGTKKATPISGQTVRIRMEAEIAERGFWVPSTALISDHRGLWSCFVWNEESGGKDSRGFVRRQSVEVIHQENDRAFVRGTLRDGSWLVTNGVHRLVDRQRIDGVKARKETSRENH